ncbi:hypothetical protein BTR14_02580 [Rhizobium rhizosphaerae]|uniref:Uncharacterized protein n=1 Tax=Xaviernesmea rhizosphaerae TaxID=1672749 RepID=A0ABX3PJM5_9HYPH|nr:hypothetical protein [Xaviernesmea rhizosphaerae]OQP88341.1 hypothetical protein BTR14_02580 [Xaviernesmea rhizosphaerae]
MACEQAFAHVGMCRFDSGCKTSVEHSCLVQNRVLKHSFLKLEFLDRLLSAVVEQNRYVAERQGFGQIFKADLITPADGRGRNVIAATSHTLRDAQNMQIRTVQSHKEKHDVITQRLGSLQHTERLVTAQRRFINDVGTRYESLIKAKDSLTTCGQLFSRGIDGIQFPRDLVGIDEEARELAGFVERGFSGAIRSGENDKLRPITRRHGVPHLGKP